MSLSLTTIIAEHIAASGPVSLEALNNYLEVNTSKTGSVANSLAHLQQLGKVSIYDDLGDCIRRYV